MMFVTAGLMAGCSDGPEVTPAPTPEQTYKIGDYFDEGFIKGVVVFVNEDSKSGSVVSLDEIKAVWSYASEEPMGSRWQSGRYNTDCVYAMPDWSKNYPAFQWCSEKDLMGVKKWYIPNQLELGKLFTAYTGATPAVGPEEDQIRPTKATPEEIAANKAKFNATLESKGGMPMTDEIYWSSSECARDMAYVVDMKDGSVIMQPQLLSKSEKYRFRAMADFKL